MKLKKIEISMIIIVSIFLINLGFPGYTPDISAQDSQPVIQDEGDFKLVFTPTQNPDYAGMQQFLMEYGRFQKLLDELNQNIALPTDITINFTEGDGPFYDPETVAITMNYEFIGYITALFLEAEYVEPDSEDLYAAVLDVTEFVMYHEIGHALVHVLGIPITGKEEDAVDALATVIITEFVEGGADIPLTAADTFALQAESQTEFEEAAFWDEHSLDIQRFYSIICWIYGSNPEQYAQLIEEEEIDEERAASCPEEYGQKVYSWMTLLSPFLKE